MPLKKLFNAEKATEDINKDVRCCSQAGTC